MQRVIYVHGTPRLFCLSKAPCLVSKSEKAHHTIGNNSNLRKLNNVKNIKI